MMFTTPKVEIITTTTARSAVPTKVFREALVSRYRRLKIEGGAFFLTLALADCGSDLLICVGERTRGHGATRLCPPYARY
jgi:hypothetical protein